MARKITFFIIIALLFSFLLGYGQTRGNVERELIRLNSAIQRTESLLQLLPDLNLKSSIVQNLQKAKEFRQKAIEFQRLRKTSQAIANIKMAFQMLDKIQRMVKTLPLFKLKFKERLDRKIQLADKRINRGNKREALFMLNRAKYFRRKAYLTIRDGRTYASLEYYRLAEFFADRAISFSESRQPLTPELLEKHLLETQMLYQRAEKNLVKELGQKWRPILNKIRRELRQVREMLQQDRLRAANRKLMVVNRALYRILDVSEGLPVPEQERLQLEFQALQSSFQELQGQVDFSKDPTAQKLFRRTRRLLRRISEHIESRQDIAARKELLLANRMIFRLHRFTNVQRNSTSGDLEALIDRTNKSLKRLQADYSNPTSQSILKVAEFNLDQAKRSFQKNDKQKAILHLQLANGIILKVSRLQEMNQDFDPSALNLELQRLNSLIQKLKNRDDLNEKQQINLQTAERLARIAKKAFENKNYFYTQSLIRITINLITK